MTSRGFWAHVYNAAGWINSQKTGLAVGAVLSGLTAYYSTDHSITHEFKQRAELGALQPADLCETLDKTVNNIDGYAAKDRRNSHMLLLMDGDRSGCRLSFVAGPGR